MKSIFVAILLIAALPAFTQELTLPEGDVANHATLRASIPELARHALLQLRDDNRDTLLANQFRLQLAAGQYSDAVATVDAWNQQHKLAPAERFDQMILLELYAKTKAIESRDGISFAAAFKQVLSEVLARFDDRAAFDIEYFLGTPPGFYQRRLDALLAQQKGTTTISLPNALQLIRLHLAEDAVQGFAPLLIEAIATDDARRYEIKDDVLIKTKEGATISAVVARKRGVAGTLPTVFYLNIYTDLAWSRREAKEAALRGYAGVIADSRGKRLSPDVIQPWETEVQDTYGVIDWISKQLWSNGKVGMYGASYGGFAAWAATKRPHPALKTIVPVSASQPGFGLPMQDNVFQHANYAWPFYVMNSKYLDAKTYNDQQRWSSLADKWYASGRPFREIDAVDGTPNPLLQKQILHPSFDKYWQDMQPFRRDFAKIDIPVLSMTGYFDDAGSSAVDYLNEHYKYNPRANHYLLVGPYGHSEAHISRKVPVVNGYSIDPAAQFDGVELMYQWFDYVMRDRSKPALLKDKINYQVMGANTWRHAPSIEKAANEPLKLYLSNTRTNDRYQLVASKPATAGFLEQTVDFAKRSDQNNLYSRTVLESTLNFPNSFVFASEPFAEAVSIDGIITGELKATINKKDMDVTLAFYEMMPDGKYFRLTSYLGRASYAGDMITRKLLRPGKTASIPFTHTQFVGRQMSKGSRLLVFLTVSKNGWAQINYGTGKDVSDESIADAKEPLLVRWHNDSYVSFPIRRQAD